jgi:hypothetical protein
MRFPVATLMIGVLSGLATAVAARFWSGLNAFVGLFFGIAVSFLVWRKYKRHSALLVTALLATSVASYCAAIWGTPYLFSTADRFLGWQNNFMEPFGPGTFAIAGFVGALIFNLALLLLLSPKGRLLLGKAAAWACAGALLGLLSAELAKYAGAAVAAVVGIPWTDMGTNDYYLSLYSAYLVWQTGMCFLIPFMVPNDSLPPSRPDGPMQHLPVRLTTSGKVFFGVIFIVVAAYGYLFGRDVHRQWRYQRTDELRRSIDQERRAAAVREKEQKQQAQIAESIAEAPPGYERTEVNKQSAEKVLVLSSIERFSARIPTVQGIPARYSQTPNAYILPAQVRYSISYSRPAEYGHSLSVVNVVISQYPTGAWAQYELRNTPEPNMSIRNQPIEQVTKFGNDVMRYRVLNFLPAYYWVSDDKTIVVYCDAASEAVLHRYLIKHPSSMGHAFTGGTESTTKSNY